MRKIVTAKDFEFSPRKESAAKPGPSSLRVCMHYACTATLREKCLGSRKAHGVGCLVSLYAAKVTSRYKACRCACLCACRYPEGGYTDARNFAGGPSRANKIL